MENTIPLRYLFIINVLCAFLACLFSMIALISVSDKLNDLKNLSWAVGKSDGQDLYVSLIQAVQVKGSVTQRLVYDSPSKCTAKYCDDCSAANYAVTGTVAICFLFTLPCLLTNTVRATTSIGNGMQATMSKYHGILYSSLSIIFGIASVVIFSKACQDRIKSDPDLVTLTWEWGTSFNLMIAVIVLKSIDLLGNAFFPIEERVYEAQLANTEIRDAPSKPITTNDIEQGGGGPYMMDDTATHRSVSNDQHETQQQPVQASV